MEHCLPDRSWLEHLKSIQTSQSTVYHSVTCSKGHVSSSMDKRRIMIHKNWSSNILLLFEFFPFYVQAFLELLTSIGIYTLSHREQRNQAG